MVEVGGGPLLVLLLLELEAFWLEAEFREMWDRGEEDEVCRVGGNERWLAALGEAEGSKARRGE